MPEKTTIHGFPVTHEQNAEEGIHYLGQELDYNEAKIFFDQAREHGSSMFEDHERRQYTLIYQNGPYTLVRR